MVTSKKLPHLAVELPKGEPAKIPCPPELPQLPFLIAAYGCRGSGKSTSIASMLRKYKQANAAHRIWLICPTYKSNAFLWDGLVDPEDVHEEANQAALDAVIAEAEDEAEQFKKYIENKAIFERYKREVDRFIAGRIHEIDERILVEAIQAGVAEYEEYPPYKWPGCQHPSLILVVDDCMSSSLFNPSTKHKNNLSNLCIKHRHIGGREHGGLSIIMALQSFKSQTGVLNRSIRQNCTAMAIWGIRDDDLLKGIHGELGREIEEGPFFAAYDYCIRDRHDFFMAEFGPLRLRRNLDEIINLETLVVTEKNDDAGQGNANNGDTK